MLAILRDALIAAVAAAALGLGVNAARSGGIPVVARQPYQVLVPCPVVAGKVDPMPPSDPRLRSGATLIVDARDAAAFGRWHVGDALSVPFDYLTPTPDAVIRRIAGSGKLYVAVYGDGQDPDSGHELASEISAKGIRNVHFVPGGAPALGAPAEATP